MAFYKYDVYDCVLHRRCGPASRWSSTRSSLTFKRARSHNISSSGNFNENKVDDNLIAYYTDTHFVPFTEWNTDLIARACKVYCVKYPIQ